MTGDIEEIKQLKARYFRLLDTKRWAEWRGVFTDDCRFEGTRRTFPDADDFVAATSAWLGPAVTIHHGHMPEIALTGTDTARGIWAMYDWVEFPEPTPEGPFPGGRGFVGSGHYEEAYRREAGAWKIALLRLTRLRLDPVETSPRPTRTDLLRSSGSEWLLG